MLMNHNIFIVTILLSFSLTSLCQTEQVINQTDAQGRKQGHWIKKYPHGAIQYEGDFRDNHPVGEFRRYFEDTKLMSVLVYSDDGTEADASFYHPNGFISSKGRYINQLREGKWRFYSEITEGYLINEEEYRASQRNGLSVKYFTNGAVAEKLSWVNGKKEGEWYQYFPDGKMFIRSFYKNNMLNGRFEVWFENGNVQFSGAYKNNRREGTWIICDENGRQLYRMEYVNGFTNDRQMEIDASDYLDRMEKNAGKIPDPEKTGEIR